jgi:hypothetical protein
MNPIQKALAYAANIKNALGGVVDNALRGPIQRADEGAQMRREQIQNMFNQEGLNGAQRNQLTQQLPPGMGPMNWSAAIQKLLGR